MICLQTTGSRFRLQQLDEQGGAVLAAALTLIKPTDKHVVPRCSRHMRNVSALVKRCDEDIKEIL